MNLESQVCSLELSKKLLTLGVKQNSLWYWCDTFSDDWKLCYTNNYENDNYLKDLQEEKAAYSAFTVAELFELLPAFIDTKMDEPFNNFYLQIQKRTVENIKYIGVYVCDSMPGEEIRNPLYQMQSKVRSYSSKLADCLAEMLIFLLENGLTKNE